MMRFLGILGAVFTVAALPPAGMASTAEADRAVFDKVDARLERGGDMYAYYNLENFRKLMAGWSESLMARCLDDGQAELADKALGAVGLDAIVAYGQSSKGAEVDGSTVYRMNQFIYTADQPRDGVIWDFIGGNVKVADITAGWPSGTVFAVAGAPDFGKMVERLLGLMPEMAANMQLAQAAGYGRIVSGPMELLLFDRGDGMTALRLTLTDTGNVLFGMARMSLMRMPGVRITEDAIEVLIPPQLPIDALVLKKGVNSLAVMTMKDMDRVIADSIAADGGLAADAEFRKLAAGMPEEAAVVSYLGPDGLNMLIRLVESFQSAALPVELPEAPSADWDQSCFGVGAVVDDGLYCVSTSRVPMMEYQIRQIFFQLRSNLQQQRAVIEMYKNMAGEQIGFGDEEAEAVETADAGRMREVHMALLMYAFDHNESLPEGTPEQFSEVVALYTGKPLTDAAAVVYLGAGLDLQSDDCSPMYPVAAMFSADGAAATAVLLDGSSVEIDLNGAPATAAGFVEAYLANQQLGEVETSLLETNAREWDRAAGAE